MSDTVHRYSVNLSHATTIIYLTGKPGVGKYTIAKELAAKHGFIICDNQLMNNPIFELLQYNGYAKIPDFAWDAIARIRTEVFDFLTKIPHNNYVLTNNLYDDEGDRKLYEQVKDMAEKRTSLFVPIRLICSQEEHAKRITNHTRRERWKSIDPQDVYDTTPLLPITHPNLREIEISNLHSEEVADIIMDHISSLKNE